MWRGRYRGKTTISGHQQVGADHNLLVVPAGQRRLIGGGQQWSSQVRARFGSELTVGSSLRRRGCPFVASLSSYHLRRPRRHTLFTILFFLSLTFPSSPSPAFSLILYIFCCARRVPRVLRLVSQTGIGGCAPPFCENFLICRTSR